MSPCGFDLKYFKIVKKPLDFNIYIFKKNLNLYDIPATEGPTRTGSVLVFFFLRFFVGLLALSTKPLKNFVKLHITRSGTDWLFFLLF